MSTTNGVYRHEVPLSEIVGEQIRSRILSGELGPGSRLVERDLADLFEVSRSPVRDALRMLEQEGLVEKLPTRGIMVKRLRRTEVEEIFDIREALEGMASRLAAQRVANGAPSNLSNLVAKSRAAHERDDLVAVRSFNWGFHDEIISFSGNETLQVLITPLMGRLHWLLRQISDFDRIEADHMRLASAIESGYPDLAQAEAQRHVRSYRTMTMSMMFGNGEPVA